MDYDAATSDLMEWLRKHGTNPQNYSDAVKLMIEFVGYTHLEICVPNNSQFDYFFRVFKNTHIERVKRPSYDVKERM